jgi:hypothetical protein
VTRAALDAAAAKYRRTYDRLYTASARAGSAAECEEIDRKLAAANAAYDAAKAAYAARSAS